MSLVTRNEKQKRNVLFALLLLGVFTLVGLVLAELIVRFVYQDITTTGDFTSYFSQRWREENKQVLNSLGFREREIIPIPRNDQFRIVVIGDSFTYGQGVLRDQRFTNILERQLNTSGKHFEVLNFGEAGTETIEHTETLREILTKLYPDYVLLQWFVNDVEGNNYDGRPTYLPLIPVTRVANYLHLNSALYYLANLQWVRLQKVLGLGPGYTYSDYLVQRFDDPNSDESQTVRRDLEAFINLGKTNGVPVGMVIFPQMTDNLLSDYPLGFLLDRTVNVCEKNSIPCLDLRRSFAAVDPPSDLWVNQFDTHPGRLANELVAAEILEKFGPIWRQFRE